MSDITLTFGKHNGKKLSEIPRDYVVWLAENAFKGDVKVAAQTFLSEHPATESTPTHRSRQPGPAPRTLREASKLGWMAERHYGNARETLLAARDENGCFVVIDEDGDEEGYYHLCFVTDGGMLLDTSGAFYSMSYAQAETLLAHYPRIDGREYLVDIAEREKDEQEDLRHQVVFQSLNNKHTIVLHVWSAENIDVSIDGREQGPYKLREPNEKEHNDGAVAILEPDIDDPWVLANARLIGLTPERKALVEQKIQEITKK